MPRLPVISGRQALAAFARAGFEVKRQRGSHIIMAKPGFPATTSSTRGPGLSVETALFIVLNLILLAAHQPNSFRAASACSSPKRMSMSRYIVAAVVRFSRA